MREFNFRVWDSFNQTMKYCEDDTWIDYLSKFFIEYDNLIEGENNPILMQYTGLKDKFGKDIYEGDIVKQEIWVSVGKYSPSIGIVKYKSTEFTSECIGDWTGSNAKLNGNAEVIGNIYENPEILTK